MICPVIDTKKIGYSIVNGNVKMSKRQMNVAETNTRPKKRKTAGEYKSVFNTEFFFSTGS